MQIVPVDAQNLQDAACVHAESWRASHREICSAAFVEAHTTERQLRYLQEEQSRGKALFLLLAPDPVGVVSVYQDVIENLYVLPDRQERGYGSRLLDYACSLCRKPKLWVLNSNTRARIFYENHGFQYTGREKRLSDILIELEMER